MNTLNGDLLPCGWAIAPLSDIAEINPRGPDRLPNDDDLVSFVPMAAVEPMSGRLNSHDLREWKTVKKGFTRFQEGDVLIAKITPCMENGKVALASRLHAGVGAGSTEFHVLRPTGAAEAKFLMYYALQEQFRKDARAKMTGTAGQLRVPASFLEERVLEVPPVPEQRRIVGAIESYSTKLDAAVAALEQVRANLKRYRASVLKAAVEGRLVPTEAGLARKEERDFEHASVLLDRILAERRRRWEESELAWMKAAGKPPKDDRWKSKYKEPAAPNTIALPQLPAGWCWATGDQISSFVTKGSSPNWQGFEYCIDGIPFVRSQNVRWGRLDLSDLAHLPQAFNEKETKSVLNANDVLLNIVGASIGRAALVSETVAGGNINQAVAVVRLVRPGMLPGFAVIYLISPSGQLLIHGKKVETARANVSLEDIRELSFPLPPLAEQERIISEAQRQLTIADSVESTGIHNLARSDRLRQSILKWAFEGKLVDQDPNDEPASVLLDRIRSERATLTGATKSRKTNAHQIEAAK